MAMQQPVETPTFIQKVNAKILELIEEGIEYVASWQIGQQILKYTDRCLWTIEKSAEWSVPNKTEPAKTDANGTVGKQLPLIRPLPWLFFLPMLILIRGVRAGLNIGAFCLGIESVKPSDIVHFVQLRRRRVRAIKYLGLKRMRQRGMCQNKSEELVSWKEKIYKLMSGVICYNNNVQDVSEKITAKDIAEEPSSKKSPTPIDLKKKYREILKNEDLEWDMNEENDEEILKRIDDLAEEDSDEDPDFKPNEDESASDEELLSNDDDDENSTSTVKVLHRPSSHNSLTNETIEEENEDSDSSESLDSENESLQCRSLGSETPTNNLRIEINGDSHDHRATSDSALTSEEYYSPQTSISTTPEPPKENVSHVKEPSSIHSDEVFAKSDSKQASENFINSEKTQNVTNG